LGPAWRGEPSDFENRGSSSSGVGRWASGTRGSRSTARRNSPMVQVRARGFAPGVRVVMARFFDGSRNGKLLCRLVGDRRQAPLVAEIAGRRGLAADRNRAKCT